LYGFAGPLFSPPLGTFGIFVQLEDGHENHIYMVELEKRAESEGNSPNENQKRLPFQEVIQAVRAGRGRT